MDLQNPGYLKLLLLSHGVNFHDSQLALVGKKYAENRYYYNISNPLDFFSNKLPSELLLPKNVEASIYFNPESPLSIKNHEKSFALYYGNKYICKAELNPRPKFFDKTLSGQVQAQQIIYYLDSAGLPFRVGREAQIVDFATAPEVRGGGSVTQRTPGCELGSE